MLKKIFALLLCMACWLTVTTLALAEGVSEVSDVPLISDAGDLPSEEPLPPDVSDEITQIQLFISSAFSDTDLLITVTDELGSPVPGVPLAFDVGSTINMTSAFTGSDGTAAITILGLDPGTVIVCHSPEFSTDSATYLSAEAVATVPGEVPTTTTDTVDTTATTAPTEPPTAPTVVTTLAPLPTLPSSDATGTTRSMPTYSEIRGATTTWAHGDEVHTNLLIDEHLLNEFGHSIQLFDQAGRLILDRSTYASLTEVYGSHLFGKLTTSALSDVTTDQIRTAKKSVPEFADCSSENAVALTFAVSLQFLEDNGNGLPVTDASSLGSDLMFEFSLPVPKSMERCKSFGIAMTGENVLNPLTPVTVNDGVISFRTPALGHFTLVGFTDGASAGGSRLGTIMWVLIGLGVLMLALMGFLIYWFFFRGRGDDPDDDPDGDGDNGDNPGGDGDDPDDPAGEPELPAATAETTEEPGDRRAEADKPAEEPPLLAADGTPLDVAALKQSWMEEDAQVQSILRDVKRNTLRREQDKAVR